MPDARDNIPVLPDDWLEPQPLGTARALPAPLYTDAGLWPREREAVFSRSWQLVARTGQLAESGDHVVAEIAGVPLVAVRGDDGALRCFHNVCRHRAGPLALCDGRGARALHCKYHGWTYRLDGSLRSAPEMQDAERFEVDGIRLPEASIEEWRGLVFVSLDPEAPLWDMLARIGERLAGRELAGFDFDRRVSYEVCCNWKTYVDNFLEGYHLPHVHPSLNRMLDYRSYRTEISEWHSLQWSPLESAKGPYGDGDALYYFVWPNTMLNILPDRLQTNRVVPLAMDRCRVDFDFYYAPDTPRKYREEDQAFSDEVQREDVAICEAVQRGLASGSYTAGRLNPKRESGVHHFHELLRRAFRETP